MTKGKPSTALRCRQSQPDGVTDEPRQIVNVQVRHELRSVGFHGLDPLLKNVATLRRLQ
jgi:hypothetical protein